MSILTSTTTPTSLVRPQRGPGRSKSEQFKSQQRVDLHFQHLLSSAVFIICTCALQLSLFIYQTARFLLQNGLYAGKVFTINAYLATKKAMATAWKRTEPLRRKLFFEFMIWILNPYAVVLFIFWPGWLLLLGFLIMYWRLD